MTCQCCKNIVQAYGVSLCIIPAKTFEALENSKLYKVLCSEEVAYLTLTLVLIMCIYEEKLTSKQVLDSRLVHLYPSRLIPVDGPLDRAHDLLSE